MALPSDGIAGGLSQSGRRKPLKVNPENSQG
jgi:hypothetical protein